MSAIFDERRLRSHARIWLDSETPVGSGFVVGPRHIMTCAHVVADALNRRQELVDRAEAPGEEVLIDLSFAPGWLKARVVPDKWRPRRSIPVEAELDDVAVLELLPGFSLPDGSRMVGKSRRVEPGDTISGIGLGRNYPAGVAVRGRFQDQLNPNRATFIASEVAEAVRPGCSGAAAWNLGAAGSSRFPGIIGMIVEMQQDLVGKVIPVTLLDEFWPIKWEDEFPSISAERPSPAAASAPLVKKLLSQLREFDRQEQLSRFEGLLTDQWDAGKKPLICTIAGLKPDKPDWCRDRCRTIGLDKRFKRLNIPTRRVDMISIPWPAARSFDYEQEFCDLLNAVRAFLDVRHNTPDDFRLAYNRILNPVIFYSNLDQKVIREGKDEHLALLRGWMDFWAKAGTKPLKKPFVHFLLLTLEGDGTGQADPAAYQEFYEELLRGVGVDQKRSLPLLRPFDRDEVDVWLGNVADDVRLTRAQLGDLQSRTKDLFQRHPAARLSDLEEWVEQLSVQEVA